MDIQKDSSALHQSLALLGLFKERIGSNFAWLVICWSGLMAVLYQYTNPFKAVTDTMRRANHEPHCNRMIQGELVSWNCIRGSLQPNPGPCCMFGFLTFRSCQLKKKWHGVFLFHSCTELSYRWCVAYAYRWFYQQTYRFVKLGCHCFPKAGASVWLHVSELFWWTDMLSIKRVLTDLER